MGKHGVKPFVLAFLVPVIGILSSPAAASAPLATLLIHRSDLRSGYTRNLAPGYTRVLNDANWNPTNRQLALHGYLGSYEGQFDVLGASRIALARVQEEGDRYRSPTGAHWGYLGTVNHSYPQVHHITLPRVGDESITFHLVLPQPPGHETLIVFRQGNYMVWIAGAGTADRSAAVLVMARLIDQRIRTQG